MGLHVSLGTQFVPCQCVRRQRDSAAKIVLISMRACDTDPYPLNKHCHLENQLYKHSTQDEQQSKFAEIAAPSHSQPASLASILISQTSEHFARMRLNLQPNMAQRKLSKLSALPAAVQPNIDVCQWVCSQLIGFIQPTAKASS